MLSAAAGAATARKDFIERKKNRNFELPVTLNDS